MIRIEYEGARVEVPESWNDIPLGFYETFYAEEPATARDRVGLVAKICKIEPERLLGWPAEVFDRIVSRLDFLFEDNPAPPSPVVEIEGVRYVVPIEDELSLGAWVDADEVQKNGEHVLSGLLAIVCRPVGESYDCRNNESRRALFASLPVGRVLPVLAFFLHCKNVSDRRIEAYTNLARTCDLLPRSISPFPSRGVGTRLLRIRPALRYWILIVLLRYRLRRFLRSCSTSRTRTMRKQRSTGWTGL